MFEKEFEQIRSEIHYSNEPNIIKGLCEYILDRLQNKPDDYLMGLGYDEVLSMAKSLLKNDEIFKSVDNEIDRLNEDRTEEWWREFYANDEQEQAEPDICDE